MSDEIWETTDPEELYILDNVIGYGHFGKVYKAKHKETGDIVAIKILPVVEDDEEALKTLKREIKLMKECDSNFIVKFYGSYLKGSDLWIVMEYCDGGSLSKAMAKLTEPLNEQEIQVVMKHMILGLEFLHSKRMIHRDIKADNVLINTLGQAKLADLGVAAKCNTMENRTTATGTPYWMAPELIKEESYSSEVDIWSLGITAIELAERKPPFFDMVPMRALFVIATGDKEAPKLTEKEKWSNDFHSFISKCLVKEPKLRLSAKQLLDEPFIAKAPSEEVLKIYTMKFLQFKEMKQIEKDLKKQNRGQLQPSNAIDRLKDFNSLNNNNNAPAQPSAILLPICGDCGLFKENIVWEGLPFLLPKRKHTLANVSNQQRLNIDHIEILYNMMKDLKNGIERKTRTYRLRLHKDCFVGSDAVDWLIEKLKIITREEGVAIAESLMHRGFIFHVLKCEPFQDNKNLFYRFSNKVDMDKDHLENGAKITYLADMMRWAIDIKDRRWKHKNYIMTFLGNEAVDWLVQTLQLQNRNEAIEISQIMMDRCIIHHINFVEVFTDKPTLYRFFRDDGKYDSVLVSSHTRSSAFEKANTVLADLSL